MPAEPLRVLLVEDDEDDFALTTSPLSEMENQEVRVEWAAGYGAGIPARYGGEEPAIILPEMNSRQAVGMAERLRRRVAACPFESRGRDGRALRIPVTISLGVAGLPGDALDADALVAAADEGLYAANRGGRNRAVRFGDLTEQTETT